MYNVGERFRLSDAAVAQASRRLRGASGKDVKISGILKQVMKKSCLNEKGLEESERTGGVSPRHETTIKVPTRQLEAAFWPANRTPGYYTSTR
jgi:hypothetical protein